jgi:hypothetical protein
VARATRYDAAVVPGVEAAARAVRTALGAAARGLVDRDVLVDLVALAAVAGEHLLVLGPPGTAKSQAVRRVSRALGGRYFEYLLGRFTEPSEIVGPIDLRRLRDGVIETQTAGMLPDAEIAFLDEVFLGSTAILNTRLSLLNERTCGSSPAIASARSTAPGATSPAATRSAWCGPITSPTPVISRRRSTWHGRWRRRRLIEAWIDQGLAAGAPAGPGAGTRAGRRDRSAGPALPGAARR